MTTAILGKIITPSSATIVLKDDGGDRVETIPSSDSRFDKICQFFQQKGGKLKTLLRLLAPPDVSKVVPELREKAREAVISGVSQKPLERFSARLAKNTSASAKASLLGYAENHGVTITEDGSMVFYKRVDNRLRAYYDSSYQYTVGKWATVDRKRCYDQPDNPCGFGLHVCPWKFLSQWFNQKDNSVLLELVCPPEDFVSVPPSQGKLLTCRVFVRRVMKPGDTPLQALVETKEVRRRATSGKPVRSNVPKGREAVPVTILQEAGWQRAKDLGKLRIVVTDPRSRFFFITSMDNETLQQRGYLKRPVPFYTRDGLTADPDRLTLPVTKADLAACQIASPLAYKILEPGLVQARPHTR